MLTIGRSNYMRFNHPAEAKLMKSVLPNSRISVAPINFEVESNGASPKINKKPPVVPKKSPRESLSDSSGEEPPSSIMTKVSKFEYLAAQNLKKSISPKVFSSNLVTVNIPAKDVLGKTPDIQSLSKHLPQSALNYADLNEMQKNKTPDRMLFGRKSPQYVNVSINDTKHINNRVVLFESDCKNQQNINELNNVNVKNSSNQPPHKTVNLNTNYQVPSPSYQRNHMGFRSVTSSPVSNILKINHRLSGSVGDLVEKDGSVGNVVGLEDLAQRNNEAEIRRNQVKYSKRKNS